MLATAAQSERDDRDCFARDSSPVWPARSDRVGSFDFACVGVHFWENGELGGSMDMDLNNVLEGCQHRVKSADEFWTWIRDFQSGWGQRPWAFRGQSNSAWPLQSKLYRKASENFSSQTNVDVEATLQLYEEALMRDAYQRGLPFQTGARTSYLQQLALLQHYGAPTRLIDVSFDINVAAWFACEGDDADGRLFAFSYATEDQRSNYLLTEVEIEHIGQDVSSKNPNVSSTHIKVSGRTLIDHLHCPWKWHERFGQRLEKWKGWTEAAYIWRPAHHDRRLLAQNGGFLLGGYPASSSRVSVWNESECKTTPSQRNIESSVKTDWSVANPDQWRGRGRTAKFVTLSVVIAKEAKNDILNALTRFHGLTHERVYPDYPGTANNVSMIFKDIVPVKTERARPKSSVQPPAEDLRTDAA